MGSEHARLHVTFHHRKLMKYNTQRLFCSYTHPVRQSTAAMLNQHLYNNVCKTGKRGYLGHFAILRKVDLKLDN